MFKFAGESKLYSYYEWIWEWENAYPEEKV